MLPGYCFPAGLSLVHPGTRGCCRNSSALPWPGEAGGHPAPTHSGLLVPLCPIWLLSHQHPFSTWHWEWEKTGALPSQLACKDDYANATMVAGDLGAGLPHGAPRTALALQRGADTHPRGTSPGSTHSTPVPLSLTALSLLQQSPSIKHEANPFGLC